MSADDVLLLNAGVSEVLEEDDAVNPAAGTGINEEEAAATAAAVQVEPPPSEPTDTPPEETTTTTSPFLDQSLLNDLRFLFKNTRYFLMKSNNFENVRLAKQLGVWSTPKINEIKLNKAFRECANVMLIFSVSESGRFQGYARLASECDHQPNMQVNWILPPMLRASSLSGLFKIDWITKADLVFQKTHHLYNPWNEMRPIKVGRDGQEFEPECGEQLCRLFDLFEKGSDSMEEFISGAGCERLGVDEVKENLERIIEKSKRRHNELVEEKRGRARSRSKSREKSDGVEDQSSDSKPTKAIVVTRDDDEDDKRRNGDSSRYQYNNRNYDYRRRNYEQYRGGYSNQAYNQSRPHPNHNPNFGYNPYGYPAGSVQHQSMPPYVTPDIPTGYVTAPATTPYGPGVAVESGSYQSERVEGKKPRHSSKYIPNVPKDIILKSTYEEYLAAFMGNQGTSDPNGHYQSGLGLDYAQYNQYGYSNTYQEYPSSKYDQDVEAFLRRTAAGPTSNESRHNHSPSPASSTSSSRHHRRERHHDRRSRSRSRSRDRDRKNKKKHKSRERK